MTGQAVVLVGFPAGIEAMLAKIDAAEAREIVAGAGMSTGRLSEALAARGLVRPSTTQGHIADITDTDVVFDAADHPGRQRRAAAQPQRAGDRRRLRRAVALRGQLLRRAGAARAAARVARSRRPTRPAPRERALSRETRLLLIVMLAAAVFRLPGLGYPTEEYFDEVYHAKTARAVPARRGPHRVGASPDGEAADRGRRRRLRLRAVGLAARPGARRHPARARVPAAGAARARDRAGGPVRDAAAAARRRLPRAEPDRDDQRLRRAVPAALGAAAARAVLEPRLALRAMSLAGLALGLALSTRWTSLWAWGFLGLVFLAVRGRRAFAPRELALGALGFAGASRRSSTC